MPRSCPLGETRRRGLCADLELRTGRLSDGARTGVAADAREAALAWYRQVLRADWATPADVKNEIRSANILKDGRVVFNIAGNKYGIVVWINYPYRVVYVRFIGAHRDYDGIDAQTIRGRNDGDQADQDEAGLRG
jgi:mRNA interferase HigB